MNRAARYARDITFHNRNELNQVPSGAQPDSSKSTSQALFDKPKRAGDRDVFGGNSQNRYSCLLNSLQDLD